MKCSTSGMRHDFCRLLGGLLVVVAAVLLGGCSGGDENAATPGRSLEAPKDVAAPPADASRTKSGLAYKVLKPGSGPEHPVGSDRVTVHYTGWTTDGKMFDSSRKRNRPSTFGLRQVIAGWTEGLQLMVTGETTRFWIPEELAYRGRPGRPAGMLVFDVELLSIVGR